MLVQRRNDVLTYAPLLAPFISSFDNKMAASNLIH